MNLAIQAPQVITCSKVRAGPLEEDRAFGLAVSGARGIDVPLPVYFQGRHLGWVLGERAPSPFVWWMREARKLAPFTSYADLLSERTVNKKLLMTWHKNATTSHGQDNWYDFWPVGGIPAAGAYGGTAYTAKQHDETEAGALTHGGNVSSDTKHVTSCWATSSDTGLLVLYDRVLTYENCSFNASVNQTMTNSLAAQRYIASGEPGLKIMITAESALGATAAYFSQLRYTDNEGNTLQSVPTTVSLYHIVSASAPSSTYGARVIAPTGSGGTLPWGPFMPLAVGDTGARLINDFTTSAANTGTITFTLLYPLAMILIPTYNSSTLYDEVMMRTRLPRVYDGACLSLLVRPGSTGGRSSGGGVEVTWG